MELHLLVMVALRATIVYAFLFVMVRLMGKRHLGVHSAFDLIVAIVLANLASEAIFGAVTLLHSLFAVAIVAGWHFAGRHLRFHNAALQRWLVTEPTVIIRDGEILTHALRAERLPEAELWSLLRQQGVEEVAEVKLAILEPSGHVSIVRQEWARGARLGDLQLSIERGER